MTIPSAPPPNWGNDKLTAFLDDYRTNQYATYANKEEFKTLRKIDDCFFRILDKPINPRPWFPFQFIHRSHSAFRAACGMIMAGQLQESNAMLRLSLETAAYGYYVSTDQLIAEAWLQRHDGLDQLKDFKRKFQHVTVRELIKANAGKLGQIFEELYERTIDYGAHPNERGFSMNSKIEENADAVNFLQIYLHGDGLLMDFAIKSCAQVGVWNLSIFQLVYPEKFQLLGVKVWLEELRKRL